jgi:hypothetical protein
MPIDFTSMTSDDISRIIQMGEVELRERNNLVFEDAITHHLYVDECPDHIDREEYLEYLQGPGSHHPAAQTILADWDDKQSQEDRKQSMRTTGA